MDSGFVTAKKRTTTSTSLTLAVIAVYVQQLKRNVCNQLNNNRQIFVVLAEFLVYAVLFG